MRIPLLVAVLATTAFAAGPPPPPTRTPQPTPPSQLTVDESFDAPISEPAFPAGKGPLIVVDEHHRNVVSLGTYFGPVGRFLSKDGYRLKHGTAAFTPSELGFARIMVIANAQAPEGAPAGSSAVSNTEVGALKVWVRGGGGLLLIADRAPFGGPARALARAFGVTLDDNTLLQKGADGKPTGELSIEVASDGNAAHPLLKGVARLRYIVGESVSGPGVMVRAPRGVYSGATAKSTSGPPAAGKPIVLAFAHGAGRVVVIGDAGIASAFGSVDGAAHRGISEADNARFVRNVFRWLAH